MTLNKLKTAPFILIEDDSNCNMLPLVLELVQPESTVDLFSFEQPVSIWRNVFKNYHYVSYHEDFDIELFSEYISQKRTIIVDSVNQMSLCLGWNECLKYVRRLVTNQNIERLILILHRECLTHSSKLLLHLNHLASATVSYDNKNPCKVWIKLKKGSKVIKSEEVLSYDTKTSTLKSFPVVKEDKKEEEPEKPLPSNLSTFKIEVDQTDKIEKYKLKLPYMSKINEGESKVYYEPDAVDDWDEEDPDEDLDI